jgi:multidrug resistance efflux pump
MSSETSKIENKDSSRHHFRAVSPQSKQQRHPAIQSVDSPLPNSSTASLESTQSLQKPDRKFRIGTRVWIVAMGIVSVGIVSQIRVHPTVRAEAWLEPVPGTRQMVHMDIAGTIVDVLVQSDEMVDEGKALIIVESEPLESEISEWQLRLQERLEKLENSHQQIAVSRSQIQRLQQQEVFIAQRVEQLQVELDRAEMLPQILAKRKQISSLKERKANLEETRGAYQSLVKEGAVAAERVREIERQLLGLQTQIDQIESEIAAIVQQKYDELKSKQEDINRLSTSRQHARQELVQSRVQMESQQPAIAKLKEEIDRRKQRLVANKIVRAPKHGTVITPHLYQLQGRFLQRGEVILEIADPSQLMAIIQVRQEDADLVTTDAPVVLKPLEPGLESLRANINGT